jgi:hypothetical protein
MKFVHIIWAILREIFEESAYERFCTREGVPRGRDSYAGFLRNPDRKTKIRCC